MDSGADNTEPVRDGVQHQYIEFFMPAGRTYSWNVFRFSLNSSRIRVLKNPCQRKHYIPMGVIVGPDQKLCSRFARQDLSFCTLYFLSVVTESFCPGYMSSVGVRLFKRMSASTDIPYALDMFHRVSPG